MMSQSPGYTGGDLLFDCFFEFKFPSDKETPPQSPLEQQTEDRRTQNTAMTPSCVPPTAPEAPAEASASAVIPWKAKPNHEESTDCDGAATTATADILFFEWKN